MTPTPDNTCTNCNVPLELHGTECGWINAKTLVNEIFIITDSRHPGFGKHLNRWKGSYLEDGDAYDIAQSTGFIIGYDQAEKDRSIVERAKEEDQIDKDAEKAFQMIVNFYKGYKACIDNIRAWNGGDENPCHLDVYNHLISIENGINERAKDFGYDHEKQLELWQELNFKASLNDELVNQLKSKEEEIAKLKDLLEVERNKRYEQTQSEEQINHRISIALSQAITGICLALIIFVWDNADYLDTRERIGFEVLGASFLCAYGLKWFVNRIKE